MGSLSQFFDPQQPPPPAVVTPQDAGLLQRITKLVEFATRNGPSFVELIKSKQRDNAEYGFLFDGEGSAFYRYSLYCGLSALGAAQPSAQPSAAQAQAPSQVGQPQQQPDGVAQQQYSQQQQPISQPQYPAYDQSHQQAYPQPYGMPPEVASGFGQVLSSLTGSRDSIRSSAAWFLAAQQHAWSLAQQMAAHTAALPDHQQRLHVVYLANDLLLKALEARPAGSAPEADAVAAALRPALPGMLAATATAGGATQEAKDRLVQIVHFWRDKGVYDAASVAEMETAVSTGQVTQQPALGQHQYQQPLPAPGAYPQGPAQPYGHQPALGSSLPPQQWGAAPTHPEAPQGGAYPQQPGVSPPPPAAWYPPPGVPSAAMAPPPDLAFAQQAAGGYAPVPQVAPITTPTPPLPNPIGFPPGLLPQLVRAREGDGSYTPIPEGDVAAAKMPPLREPDAYLKSRLDQFKAELQDYRPGLTRADVEALQRAQRRAEGRADDAAHPAERSHAQHAKTFDGPPPRSSGGGGGGGGGGRGGGYIGLGFEEERRPQMTERQGDQFEAFRQQRSSGYYDMIGRNSVDAAVKRGESFGGRG